MKFIEEIAPVIGAIIAAVIIFMWLFSSYALAHGGKHPTCHQHGATATHCHGGKP